MKNSECVSGFLSFARQSKSAYKESKDILLVSDNETQDILHTIEMRRVNAVSLIKLATLIRDVRQNRRAAKDEILVLEPFVQWCKKYPEALKELEGVLGEMRKSEEHIADRHYFYRTKIVNEAGIDGEFI